MWDTHNYTVNSGVPRIFEVNLILEYASFNSVISDQMRPVPLLHGSKWAHTVLMMFVKGDIFLRVINFCKNESRTRR